MRAADIPDETFLGAVRTTLAVNGTFDGRWRMRGDVKATLEASMGMAIPEKLFLAKARRLMARGLLGGCPCGCRGDYHIPQPQTGCCTPCDRAITVPVERPVELATWPASDAVEFFALLQRQFAASIHLHDTTLAEFVDNLNRFVASHRVAVPSRKAVRRWRRAQLRRVHRDYIRNRRVKAETWAAVCVLDEAHRFHPDTQEAR